MQSLLDWPVQGVRAAEIKVLPQPVTKGFLSGRIDNLDARTAAEIVEALKAEGMLNPAGFLLQDPRCYPHPAQAL